MPSTITENGRLYLKWALTEGVGPQLLSRLLERFGDAETALGAAASQLTEIKGISSKSSQKIAESP